MPPELADKLLEWERNRRDGTPVTPEELCADSPQMVNELRRRIRRLEACDRLLGLDETPVGQTEPDSEVPTQIGGFEVRGRLGRGGMGDVYEAWDPKLRREVAIKVLRLPVDFWPFVRTQELAGRFSREGAVLARLEHPHIVPVYQGGEWQGRPYIAMALIGGGMLADRRDDFTDKSPREVAAFMEKVASAVHAAHQEGVLHRDLKPANILLDDDGEPKVADFGLAKLWVANEPTECSTVDAAAPSSELTAPGVQPGTPPYMAPEQLDPGLGPIGPATDVWSLGVILHELLTGKRPFAGDTRRELVENVCRAPAPSCRASNRRVPRWLDAVAARCLEKDPGRRYASAAELAGALYAGLQRRRQAQWFVGSIAILALVLAAGIVGGRWIIGQPDAGTAQSMPPPETPFEQRSEITEALEQLAAGKEVVFVDQTHERPFRWVFGSESGQVIRNDPGRLVLSSHWPGVNAVEFLPALPPGRYRVLARMTQTLGGDFSKVGLYAGGRRWDSATGKHLCCMALCYADFGSDARHRPEPGSTASGFARICQVVTGVIPTQAHHWVVGRDGGRIRVQTAEQNGGQKVERSLAIELGATEAKATFGMNTIGELNRSLADQFEAACLVDDPEVRPSNRTVDVFGGGVGVIVYNGIVSISELRIQPLK